MSKRVSLYEAKTNLSALVEEAAAGGEIVITKHGKAKAQDSSKMSRRGEARGAAQARRLEGPHRFKPGWDDPLPDDIIAAMCGDDPDDPLNAPAD